jgi:hypothetical protein
VGAAVVQWGRWGWVLSFGQDEYKMVSGFFLIMTAHTGAFLNGVVYGAGVAGSSLLGRTSTRLEAMDPSDL